MPNLLNTNGLQTKTQTELVTELTNAFKAIYGSDINLSQDTPDGQMLMIFTQAIEDNLDLIREVYNSFNPDAAIGRSLDQRVAINGIQRQAGTFTTTPITITTDRALNLFGANQSTEDVYTVKDSEGNEWKLQETEIITAAGDYVLNFQAALPGETFTIPNTITVPVTVILGVIGINNPTTFSILGLDEETDIDLRVRRQKSVSISSQGFLEGLLAEILNISGVTFSRVYENNTGLIDADLIPSHSIWVIVAGTGAPEEIANAIYTKRSAGVGMKGSETYDITQVDGTTFTVRWDNVVTVPLHISFNVSSIDGVNVPDDTAIKNYLIENLTYDVFEKANINDLATTVQEFDPNALVTSAGFSLVDGGPYVNILEPGARNEQFVVSIADIDVMVV